MKVKTFVVGAVSTNCYIMYNEESQSCIIIDPGAPSKAITDFIKEKQLAVDGIFLTHGHFDHIMGIDQIESEVNTPVYVYQDDVALLAEASLNLSNHFGVAYEYNKATAVKDGQLFDVAGTHLQVIHTPGHTAGSCCYYVPEAGLLFTGDTLFKGGVGRTDLPTSDPAKIVPSIQKGLLVLPEDTVCYPGHEGATSISYELAYNRYLQNE